MTKIAIDAMGGDNGSLPIVEGTLLALEETTFQAIMVGKKVELTPLIPQKYLKNITFVEASDVLKMTDLATEALKRKESSIYKAVELVKEGKANGVVSIGHSGATMSLATLKIGRIEGVQRPAIATLMPTCAKNPALVLDVGANVDCKATHLHQFAIMGSVYMKNNRGIKIPKIGLLSNGEEKSKGNEITKIAYQLMKDMEGFVGYVEGNDIFNGSVDVVVCDGFVGNVLLKTSEGIAESITSIIKDNVKKSFVSTLGALLMKKVFRALKQQVDYAEYGGAQLLGVNNCTIIGHGKSNSKAVKNAILKALDYEQSNSNNDIKKLLLN